MDNITNQPNTTPEYKVTPPNPLNYNTGYIEVGNTVDIWFGDNHALKTQEEATDLINKLLPILREYGIDKLGKP